MSASTLGAKVILKRGSRGREVRVLQRQLNAVLGSGKAISADGIFGNATESAVKQFQRQAGIRADGLAGPVTKQKLEHAIATRNAPQSTMKLGSRGADVKKLQAWLNAKSPKGPGLVTDGIFGMKTQTAVINFQSHAGLTVDGIAGKETLSALLSAPAISNTGPMPKAPSAESTANAPTDLTVRPTYDNIVSVYGDPEDWSYITKIVPPFPLYYGGTPVSAVSVHKKVANSLTTALTEILGAYGLAEIEQLRINHNYGGSVNKRRMRNGTKWSTHAWGVAIDLNHSENQLSWGSDRALFAKPEYQKMIDIFERNGWYNLGRRKNFDFMHFQAVKI